MAAALVAPRPRLGSERDADAKHDPAVRPSGAELGGQLAEFVGRKCDRVPDARAGHRRSVARDTPANQSSGPPGRTSAGESHQSTEKKLALVDDLSRHLLERGRGEVEPLVEQAPAAREICAEAGELALHPARSDGGHDPPAREQVQRRQLLQRHEGVALGHDERRHAGLKPLCLRGEEAERDEGLAMFGTPACARAARSGGL